EAIRLAVKYMTPVILVTDGYMANASEPWIIPEMDALEPFPVINDRAPDDFAPYARDPDSLSRPWVVPGTPGGIHRIGGLERAAGSGNVSYDPDNHQAMTDLRAAKIAGIARDIPPQTVELGLDTGRVAVLGWGSSYGPINRAVSNLVAEGLAASHVHLRHIWPLPANLGDLLGGFDAILLPEMNNGQLATLLRAELVIEIDSMPKISGKPFKV